MKPLKNCPFCSDELELDDLSIEYDCKRESCRGKDDHTYLQKQIISTEELVKVTVRVGPGETRYYLVMNLALKQSEIWSGRFDSGSRIEIASIPNIDFTQGIEATKKKIKTYLTFS